MLVDLGLLDTTCRARPWEAPWSSISLSATSSTRSAPIFFVLSEVGDGYQLDPAATLVEYAETAIDGLTSDVVDRLIEEIENEA